MEIAEIPIVACKYEQIVKLSWQDAQTFLAVAERRSLSAAARTPQAGSYPYQYRYRTNIRRGTDGVFNTKMHKNPENGELVSLGLIECLPIKESKLTFRSAKYSNNKYDVIGRLVSI